MDIAVLKGWWDIAQSAGAGVAVLAGPIIFMLWKRNCDDNDYIRESNKQSLETLTELTHTISKGDTRDEARHKEILDTLDKHSQLIRNDIRARGT